MLASQDGFSNGQAGQLARDSMYFTLLRFFIYYKIYRMDDCNYVLIIIRYKQSFQNALLTD